MMLTDRDLLSYGSRLIRPFSAGRVQQIMYDLTVEGILNKEEAIVESKVLPPLGSAVVQTMEEIHLPSNVVGHLALRNNRIRQGLMLDASLYHPGTHARVFYRLINFSDEEIEIARGMRPVSIYFERLVEPVRHDYVGTFQNEYRFRDLGAYGSWDPEQDEH